MSMIHNVGVLSFITFSQHIYIYICMNSHKSPGIELQVTIALPRFPSSDKSCILMAFFFDCSIIVVVIHYFYAH
jgi:hypothetical protein